jgi:hypothetical protein
MKPAAKASLQGQAIPACRKLKLKGIDFPGTAKRWTKPSQKSLSRTKWFYLPLVRLYH